MTTNIIPTAQAIIKRLQNNLSEQQAGPVKTILEVLSEELAGGKSSPQTLINRQVTSVHHLVDHEKIQLDQLNSQLLEELANLVHSSKK